MLGAPCNLTPKYTIVSLGSQISWRVFLIYLYIFVGGWKIVFELNIPLSPFFAPPRIDGHQHAMGIIYIIIYACVRHNIVILHYAVRQPIVRGKGELPPTPISEAAYPNILNADSTGLLYPSNL